MAQDYSNPFLRSPTGPNAAWEGHPRNNFHPPVLPANPMDANNRRDEAARIAGQRPGSYGRQPLQPALYDIGQNRVRKLVKDVPRTPSFDYSKYPDLKPRGFFAAHADEFARTANLTDNTIGTFVGTTPNEYNALHGPRTDLLDEWGKTHLPEEARRKMYRPPDEWPGKIGNWTGKTTKKILDPIGVTAAILSPGTWGPLAVGGVGAGIEGAESTLGQRLTGNPIQWLPSYDKEAGLNLGVLGDAATGLVGAGGGDLATGALSKALGVPANNWIGELLGRGLLGGVMENGIKDTTKAGAGGAADAVSIYKDPLVRR